MKKPLIQIGDEVREMTDDEFDQYKADQLAGKLIQEEAQAKVEGKAAAQAKLEALGLTVEDLKALGL
jgi:hypothetical protein